MLVMIDRIHHRADNPGRHFLKEWRMHRGYTQERLAEMMETDKGTVSAMERHKKRMHEGYIYAAAYALSIEPDQLFRDPDAPSLDALLAQIPAEARQNVITMVSSLVRKAS